MTRQHSDEAHQKDGDRGVRFSQRKADGVKLSYLVPVLAGLVVISLLLLSATVHVKAQGEARRTAITGFAVASNQFLGVEQFYGGGDVMSINDAVFQCIAHTSLEWRVLRPKGDVAGSAKIIALGCARAEAEKPGKNAVLARAIYGVLQANSDE